MTGALFQPFPMLPGRRAQAWRHQPAFRRPRHFHPEPELNIVTRGTAVVGIGDEQRSLGRGDVALFHPGQDHVLLSASDDLGLFAVAISPELAARAELTLAQVASRVCQLNERETSELEATLCGLGVTADAISMEAPLSDLFRSLPARSAHTHVLSRRALEHLIADPAASGVALGVALRAPPSAVSRHFHGDLGVRFVEYRARMRLMTFVKLADGGQPLSRAALEAGFGSYAQCHRVFTAALGCSPRLYFNGGRQRIDDALFAPGDST